MHKYAICLVVRGRSHFVEWMVGSFEKQDMHFADLSKRDEVKNSIWGFPIFCASNPEIEDVFVTWQVSCIKQQKKSMSNTKLYLSLFLCLKVSTERQQITAPKNTKKTVDNWANGKKNNKTLQFIHCLHKRHSVSFPWLLKPKHYRHNCWVNMTTLDSNKTLDLTITDCSYHIFKKASDFFL